MARTDRRLILLRQAKSAWPDETPDSQRPLAGRGRRDAPAVGRWLGRHVPKIELVLCSPAVRARQTWDLAAAELATPPERRHDERLYAASADDLLRVIRDLPPQVSTALLVGHNPGLEDLLELLTGAAERLKTSAIAVASTPGTWARAQPRRWTLEALATPRGS
jgi:phosphohistidine phosphatase